MMEPKHCHIHTCCWKHNLCSKRLDQLYQAVVQSLSFKPTTASKYSASYQLFQQAQSFHGIGIGNATNYGEFHYNSMLFSKAEVKSFYNHPNINAHLSTLKKENVISFSIADSKHSFIQQFSSTIDYIMYTRRSTYIIPEASMIV